MNDIELLGMIAGELTHIYTDDMSKSEKHIAKLLVERGLLKEVKGAVWGENIFVINPLACH
jgi:hypothetical protein